MLLTVFGAPIAVSSFTMAQQMGGDDKLAGQLVVFSSIFSIGTMFLLIFFLREWPSCEKALLFRKNDGKMH